MSNLQVPASAAPAIGGRRGWSGMTRLRRNEAIWFYVLIAPWLIGFLVFSLGPIISSAYLSFTQYDMANPAVWIGLDNYVNLFAKDPLFLQSLKVTAIWVFGGLPLRLVIALFFAVLLNQKVPGMGVFRTIYYLPSVVSGVAVALLWMWLLQPQFGILNYFLRMVGLQGPQWLSSPQWALPGVHRHEPLEHGGDDDHLPRRSPGHPRGALRGGVRSTAPARSASSSPSRSR